MQRRGQDREGGTHVGTATLGELSPGERESEPRMSAGAGAGAVGGVGHSAGPGGCPGCPEQGALGLREWCHHPLARTGPCSTALRSPSGPRTRGRHGRMHPRACRLGRHSASGQ